MLITLMSVASTSPLRSSMSGRAAATWSEPATRTLSASGGFSPNITRRLTMMPNSRVKATATMRVRPGVLSSRGWNRLRRKRR